MATRTVTTLVDDLDGSVAEENVSFGLDRVDYEIDLSADHAGSLRTTLGPYLAAARRVGGRRTAGRSRVTTAGGSTTTAGPTRSRSANTEIRAWAARHGLALADRGRIPGRVIEAFEAGDPSRLSQSNGSDSPTPSPSDDQSPTAPSSTPAVTTPSASSEPEQPRGRDGLTQHERETIRGWAEEQGIEVKSRGILKKDLVANYEAWRSRQ